LSPLGQTAKQHCVKTISALLPTPDVVGFGYAWGGVAVGRGPCAGVPLAATPSALHPGFPCECCL
jgi:hypothetical protein